MTRLSPSQGTHIGSYRLLERLSSTGMSPAWRVHHLPSGSDRLLKLLDPDLRAEPALHAHFLAAASLHQHGHPSILPVLEIIDDEDATGLVMPLPSGENLADRLAREAPISPHLAMTWAAQLLSALALLHAQGHVVRHLKPASLFVCQDRLMVIEPHLSDIDSLCRQTSPRNEELYAYMSPEQLDTIGPDHRTDLFSVGAILYEMLTGEFAFQGTPHAVIQQLRAQVPTSPHLQTLGPALPAGLAAVVKQALSLDPDRRFPDAAAFSAALRGVTAPIQP